VEASLSFLNLGIKPPDPSWGNMINVGRNFLVTQPWMILAPGIILMISVLSFNFLGDGVRDILDTKRKI
jgi:ABC-type dipeptide/oligopeptide/nickel transport system permease subunit